MSNPTEDIGDQEKDGEDFFSLSPKPFRKDIPKRNEAPQGPPMPPKPPQQTKQAQTLTIKPKEPGGPAVLDLSKRRLPKPTLVTHTVAGMQKKKSDPLGNTYKPPTIPKVESAPTVPKKRVPVVDVVPPEHSTSTHTVPQDNEREKMTQGKKSINNNATEHSDISLKKETAHRTEESSLSQDKKLLAVSSTPFNEDDDSKILNEVGQKIKAIENNMPRNETHETPHTQRVTEAHAKQIDNAIRDIEGYVEMIGGVEKEGVLRSAEEIGEAARRLFLYDTSASIEDIPEDKGIRALVVAFAHDLDIELPA